MESHEGHVGPGVGLEYPRTEKMEVRSPENQPFLIGGHKWLEISIVISFFWGACSDELI